MFFPENTPRRTEELVPMFRHDVFPQQSGIHFSTAQNPIDDISGVLSPSALNLNFPGAMPYSPQDDKLQRPGRNRSPSTQSSTFLVRDSHKRRESLRRIGIITKERVVPVYARTTMFRNRELFWKIRPASHSLPSQSGDLPFFSGELKRSVSRSTLLATSLQARHYESARS